MNSQRTPGIHDFVRCRLESLGIGFPHEFFSAVKYFLKCVSVCVLFFVFSAYHIVLRVVYIYRYLFVLLKR